MCHLHSGGGLKAPCKPEVHISGSVFFVDIPELLTMSVVEDIPVDWTHPYARKGDREVQMEVMAPMPQFMVPPSTGANDDDDHEKAQLAKLGNALEEFRKTFSGSLPISYVQTFLMVALNEGASLSDITTLGDMKKSTASRALLDLAGFTGDGVAIVKRETHPTELRRNQYTLSPRGKRLVQKIIEIMEE